MALKPENGNLVEQSRILKAYLDNEIAIKRFLRKFLRNRQDIEDIAQDTFVRTFIADSIELIGAPRAYLFIVARNLALNYLAKHQNVRTVALEDTHDPSVLIGGSEPSLDDAVDARQRFQMLVTAIASLPPQCREVFVLRKIRGLSQKEIAARLGISESTVEKHVALGLLRCSKFLRERGVEMRTRPSAVIREFGGSRSRAGSADSEECCKPSGED